MPAMVGQATNVLEVRSSSINSITTNTTFGSGVDCYHRFGTGMPLSTVGDRFPDHGPAGAPPAVGETAEISSTSTARHTFEWMRMYLGSFWLATAAAQPASAPAVSETGLQASAMSHAEASADIDTCSDLAELTATSLSNVPVISLSNALELAVGSPECPSIGSKQHHHDPGACKPCAHFFKGGCQNGANCSFCHLCPPGELKRRQKLRRRLRMQELASQV